MRFWVKQEPICSMRDVCGSYDENNSLFWKKKISTNASEDNTGIQDCGLRILCTVTSWWKISNVWIKPVILEGGLALKLFSSL